MPMFQVTILFLLGLFIPGISSDESYLLAKGQHIYVNLCQMCHTFGMGGGYGPGNKSEENGPPILNISNRYHRQFTVESDAEKRYVDFLKKPAENTSVMPAQVIKRFGVKEAIIISELEYHASFHWIWNLRTSGGLRPYLHVTIEEPAEGGFTFIFPDAGEAGLAIADDMGNRLRQLKNEKGQTSVFFDGKDDAGKVLPIGSYEFYAEQGGVDTLGFINIVYAPDTGDEFHGNTFLHDEKKWKLGRGLFNSKCKICHTEKEPSSFVAPSMEVVSKYYKPQFTNIQKGIDFMAGFLKEPSADKSALPADVKAQYIDMAPIALSDRFREAIAYWIWVEWSGGLSTLPPDNNTTRVAPVTHREPRQGLFFIPGHYRKASKIFDLKGRRIPVSGNYIRAFRDFEGSPDKLFIWN